MSIRLVSVPAGTRRASSKIATVHASVFLPLESSVIDVTVGTETYAVDRSAWVLVPHKASLRIASTSPTAHALLLGISPELMDRVTALFGGEVNVERFQMYMRTTALLPRTTWVNELAHRYLFERAACKKSNNDATRFLEPEIAKELYFLCHERHAAKERPSLVDGQSDLMVRAITYIDAHLFDADVVAHLSKACAASPSTLLRAFRREVGDGPLGYVRARRLDESLLLLKSRRHSVGDVATLVGYTSFTAFSQAFRARFGMRPSDALAKNARPPTPPAGSS